MNELLVQLRKSLSLSQSAFAEKIGLSQSGYSLIEKGKRDLNDRVLKLICNEFNVNESWIRNGDGPMFKEPSDSVDTLHEIIRSFDIEQLELMKECLDMIIKEKESDKGSILNFQRTVTRPVYGRCAFTERGARRWRKY